MIKTIKISKNGDVGIGKNYIMKIGLGKNLKRSWENFKRIMVEKDQIYAQILDLRRSSKKKIPLILGCGNCGSTLEIRRKKDLPLKSKKCKCGKFYLVKWETLKDAKNFKDVIIPRYAR